MRTYLVWCDYSQDGSLKMGSLRAVAIARSQLGYELQENDREEMGLVRVSFFSLFAGLFTASLMVCRLASVARESRSCGGLLVQRSVGNRAVSRQMGTAGREW